MKNFFFTLTTVAIILIASCSEPANSESSFDPTNDSITISVIDPEFFIYKNDTIKNHRDLLWNYSLWEFGNGTDWRKWVEKNPVLQQPGRTWKDTTNGHWIALVKYGEVFVNPQPVKFEVPVSVITRYSVVEVPVNNLKYLWVLIPLILILLWVIYSLFSANKEKKQIIEINRDKLQELHSTINTLSKELETAKNQIPVKAPEIADEEWLRNNFSVGDPIADDNSNLAIKAITRKYGKKPDLIAQARVSTEVNALSMEFSHDRKATTGLKDVVVYLGWSWNQEKKIWEEVNRLVGPCSNGFEVNPDNVVKGEMFSKVELVEKDRRPILFIADHIPATTHYPEFLQPLVIKFHGDNITEIEKAGVGVVIPQK